MTDVELLNKLKERDEQALKQAFDQYKNMVFKIAIGFTHDKIEADDIVQDVFLKLWEHSPNLNLKKTKLSTWLYRVTVNHCINLTNRKKIKSFFQDLSQFTRVTDDGSVEIQIEDSFYHTPDKITENKELAHILKKAIDSLPKKQKTAFILSKYMKMSAKEIAEVMDISPGNVDVIMHRAKKNLQSKLLKLLK